MPRVSKPGDPAEREADRVADAVMGARARALAGPSIEHVVEPGSIQRKAPPSAPPAAPAQSTAPLPTPIPKAAIEAMVGEIRAAVQSAAVPGTDMAAIESALAELQRMAEGRAFYGVTGQPGAERPPLGEYDPETDTLTLSSSRFTPGATPGHSQLVTVFHEGFHATRRAALKAINAALPPMPNVTDDLLAPAQLAQLIEFNLSMYHEEALAHRVDKMVRVAFSVVDGVVKAENAEARLRSFMESPAEGTSATEHAGLLADRVPLYARKTGGIANAGAYLEAAERFANTGEGRPRLQDFIEGAPAAAPAPPLAQPAPAP